MRLTISTITAIALLALSSCTGKTEKTNVVADYTATTPTPRNIIMMIGDGMGLNQVYAAMTAAGHRLAIEQCTATAIVKTFSANSYITDSAAGGTALACGKKTDNGMLGMTPDSIPVPSILEHYRSMGYATGFVVTSPVTHATPASFYAHIPSRGDYETIASQLCQARIDFFCGGGRNHFESRSDSLSLTDTLRSKGYDIHYSIDSVKAPLLLPCGILAAEHDMPSADLRGDFLPQATDLAIKSLRAKAGEKGFFLLIEGSQIDYRCHGNDAAGAVAEVIDFDNAVAAAIEFAKADKNTLVVITADHETGGLTILDGSYDNHTVDISFGNSGEAGTSSGHTGTMVPLFAFGPGAELFHGILDNTQIPAIIRQTQDKE